MSSPPDGKYRKPYAGETVRTANGVVIHDGLRVWTNDLQSGRVSLDDADYEWHEGEGRYVLWFDVLLDDQHDGRRVMQSHDRVTTMHPFDNIPA